VIIPLIAGNSKSMNNRYDNQQPSSMKIEKVQRLALDERTPKWVEMGDILPLQREG